MNPGAGLERSCTPGCGGRIVLAPAALPGIQRIDVHARGPLYRPHRHDTYALGITLAGVQAFAYRGSRHCSLRGNVIVLHPDELHDGGAGSEQPLHYRMLYVEPALVRQALGGGPLPFVRDPVLAGTALREVLAPALARFDAPADELQWDDLLGRIARELARHARTRRRRGPRLDGRAGQLAREYLAEHRDRPVRIDELRALTGLDRFELSRQFRALFGTSPYRFHLMRRLELARVLVARGLPLAQVAAETGFADQSHLTRHFRNAFGMPPGRWMAMSRDWRGHGGAGAGAR